MEQKNKFKKIATELLIGAVSIAVVLSVVKFVEAGSLTPPAGPVAPTMQTQQTIYNNLVASSSTALLTTTASSSGNSLQITKCIINIVNGTPCP